MMKYVKQLAVALLVLLMVGCRSETLQPAAPVLDENSCGAGTKTLAEIEADAKAGCLRAQFNMGVVFNYGRKGVAQDYQKAFEWYSKAANGGDSAAQNSLALLYEQGNGVEKNLNIAIELFKKSAVQGDSVAIYNLGMRYYNGINVPINHEEAFDLMQKSAFLNFKQAQLALTKFYSKGVGVKKDPIYSMAWMKIALENSSRVDEKAQKAVELFAKAMMEFEGGLSSQDQQEFNQIVEGLSKQIKKDADPDNETTLGF